jgi:hypothetical protein
MLRLHESSRINPATVSTGELETIWGRAATSSRRPLAATAATAGEGANAQAPSHGLREPAGDLLQAYLPAWKKSASA